MNTAPDATIDPVCGMTVDPKTALSSEWNGQRIYFCNPSCKQKFDANPAAYLQKSSTPPRA
jgi:Cu+-exporting ATPase